MKMICPICNTEHSGSAGLSAHYPTYFCSEKCFRQQLQNETMSNINTLLPIYPLVNCTISKGRIGLRTYDFDGTKIELVTRLRKKHTDGLYYLIDFKKDFILKDRIIEGAMQLQQIFHMDIYQFVILGVIDPSLMLQPLANSPTPAFVLDPDQTPEEERLKKLYEV